jgi:ABC-type lipoprotein release transport system permease subunit
VVIAWQELLPGLLEGIQLDMIIAATMYVILILVVAFSILNTFIMAVFERTREFGVMMAIGTTPGRLVRILLLESAFLTLVGGVVGITLGAVVTTYYSNVGISFGEEAAEYMAQFGLPPRLHPELSLFTATFGPAFVFIITMLAALIPALRIRRLRPVEALRKI